MQVFNALLRSATFLVVLSLLAAVGTAGCARQGRPLSEADVLFDVTQLTHGFGRAGEAYFSPKMDWIIFQATPAGETHYQMYVAPLNAHEEGFSGIGEPIRISPTPSKNTCGFFSPDGNTLIFGSTAGKEAPATQSTGPASAPGGYQRSSGTYRWDFPAEMEIYRADGWEAAVRAAAPKGHTNLARHRLTDNDAYDSECAFSPDGKWIVFTSLRTGDAELFASRPNGGTDLTQLTRTRGYHGGPFFSPDGKRVIFRADRQKKHYLQLYVIDVDGKN